MFPMRTTGTLSKSLLTIAACCLFGTAKAELIDRGNGMIYDTVQNLTWLQDWNLRWTLGFSNIGRSGWISADGWTRDLVFGGFDDWRLPSALNNDGSGVCLSYGCTTNEFGNLWHVTLGNPLRGPLINTGPFINMRGPFGTGNTYFTSSIVPGGVATFWTSEGLHQLEPVVSGPLLYTVAVRNGDVMSPVPEPQTWAMWVAGLAGLAAVSARQRSRSKAV